MPLDGQALIKAAELVAESENLMVALQYSGAASVFTGLTTFGGALLGGPIGIAAGAFVGGVTSAIFSNGKFKSVVSIIREDLNPRQKLLLIRHLSDVVSKFGIEDAMEIAFMVVTHNDLRLAVKFALQKFVVEELKMRLK